MRGEDATHSRCSRWSRCTDVVGMMSDAVNPQSAYWLLIPFYVYSLLLFPIGI
ncbi:MAG: hypothetical protein KF862_25290 [Chitinophagaceae bacterium]|nr:hypothetical protein [Chitinophagaceae bacterium]